MNRTTHNKDNRLDRLLRQIVPIENAERGQMLLIMAMAMVGLLVAVGLAVDGGVLFARKAQLDRATDAAALVGVVEYADSNDLIRAHTRARQFLGANGIVVSTETTGNSTTECSAVDWTNYDFCGEKPSEAGSLPGTVRYGIEVRWRSEVYFMQLVGFDEIPIRSKAVAEYFPLVDIFTSPTAENGLIRVSNLSIFGPSGCAWFGDPRTPEHLKTNPSPDQTLDATDYYELNGIYTFRITVPASFYEDASAGGYGFTQLRIELFDPDSGNQVWNGDDDPEAYIPGGGVQNNNYGQYQIYDINGQKVPDLKPCLDQKLPNQDPALVNNRRINACLIKTGQELDENPFWVIRVDESRDVYDDCTSMPSLGGYETDDGIENTVTLYRLYYYQQTDSGGLEEVDLAYYVGKADPVANTPTANPVSSAGIATQEWDLTDLMWVSPGSPDRAPEFSYWSGVDNPVAPGSDIVSPQEPATAVENCGDARTWISNPSRKGDLIKSVGCSATTDGNFTINLPNNANSEVPDIFIDPNNGSFDIFMQVMGIAGASENAYEIWAGPTGSELASPPDPLTPADPNPYVPAHVNARNVFYMAHQADNPHSSRGVTITGLGHLNMNYNSEEPAELPLAYLGPQFSGANMTIRLFDPDGGMGPIIFYMDSIPQSDWVACFEEPPAPSGFTYDPARVTCSDYFGGTPSGFVGTLDYPIESGTKGDNDNTNGRWLDMGPFTLPGDTVPFYGGRLMVHYSGSANDTINWEIVIESRPLLIE